MKKIIFSLTLLLFVANVFSQTPTSITQSKDYYLKKNRKQKTLGWVLLGGGLGMIIAGGYTYKPQGFTGSIWGIPLQENQYNNKFEDILMSTGLAAMIGSIPLFISAHGNKKKAASLAISNQNIFLPQQNELVLKKQPTLTLRIPL